MPRVKRRRKLRNDYTRQERYMLTHGVSFTCPRFGSYLRNNINWPVLEAAWRDLEAEILPEWIEANPFTRPVGWLLFDAQKPRLAVVGEQELEAREWSREYTHFRQHFFFGINHRLGIHDGSNDSAAAFESEKQYLRRLNVLTDSERALL